jgi:hypothetical protein
MVQRGVLKPSNSNVKLLERLRNARFQQQQHELTGFVQKKYADICRLRGRIAEADGALKVCDAFFMTQASLSATRLFDVLRSPDGSGDAAGIVGCGVGRRQTPKVRNAAADA